MSNLDVFELIGTNAQIISSVHFSCSCCRIFCNASVTKPYSTVSRSDNTVAEKFRCQWSVVFLVQNVELETWCGVSAADTGGVSGAEC